MIKSIQLADSIISQNFVAFSEHMNFKAWNLFECGDKTSTYSISTIQWTETLSRIWKNEIIIWQTADNFGFDHLVRHCCGNLAFRLEQILKGKNANQLSTM